MEELRRLALSMASQEQLEVAAAGAGPGITVPKYQEGMRQGLWGGNLMIALLAKAFQADTAVISGQRARAWKACGDEERGARPEALWVARRGEWHYYGVFRAQGPSQQVVAASKSVSSAAVVAAVGSKCPLRSVLACHSRCQSAAGQGR